MSAPAAKIRKGTSFGFGCGILDNREMCVLFAFKEVFAEPVG